MAGESGTAVAVNTWTKMAAAGYPVSQVGYDKTQYIPAIDRHVWMGNYHQLGTEPNAALVGYSFTENRFDVIDSTTVWSSEHMPEGGHTSGVFAFMPVRNSLWMHGMMSGSNQEELPWHTWWYDLVGQTGRDKFVAARPGTDTALQLATSAYDQSRDKVIIYPDLFGDISAYDPVTNTYTRETSVTGTPHPGVGFASAAYSTLDRKLYFFGGSITQTYSCGATITNAVTRYDHGTKAWETLSPTGGPPAARIWAGWAYSPRDNIFLLAGGRSCSTGTDYTDTWVYDPVANTWTELSPSVDFSAIAPFERLSYDETNNAFIMIAKSTDGSDGYAGGTYNNNPSVVWAYCYTACSNAGRTSNTYTPPSGSLGITSPTSTSQSWSLDPAIAAEGANLYAGWIETGAPFDGSDCGYHHPIVKQWDGAEWTRLGADCEALSSDLAGTSDASNMHLGVVDGDPWAAFEMSRSGSGINSSVYAKVWTGSAWSGGIVPKVGTSARPAQIIADGTTPTLAILEWYRVTNPRAKLAYVRQWDGADWDLLGSHLNSGTDTRANSLAIASDGTNPWACLDEDTVSGTTLQSSTNTKVYCFQWDGAEWDAKGSALNQNSSTGWAGSVSMTYVGGSMFVAFTERTASGNPKLYLKRWTGTEWELITGAAINIDTTNGWPFRPRLTNDGTNVFISWEEQVNLNEPNRTYASRWDGSAWTRIGGTATVSSAYGSSAGATVAVYDSKPTVILAEVSLGNLRQPYVRQFDSTWQALGVTSTETGRTVGGGRRVGGGSKF